MCVCVRECVCAAGGGSSTRPCLQTNGDFCVRAGFTFARGGNKGKEKETMENYYEKEGNGDGKMRINRAERRGEGERKRTVMFQQEHRARQRERERERERESEGTVSAEIDRYSDLMMYVLVTQLAG